MNMMCSKYRLNIEISGGPELYQWNSVGSNSKKKKKALRNSSHPLQIFISIC